MLLSKKIFIYNFAKCIPFFIEYAIFSFGLFFLLDLLMRALVINEKTDNQSILNNAKKCRRLKLQSARLPVPQPGKIGCVFLRSCGFACNVIFAYWRKSIASPHPFINITKKTGESLRRQ